MSRGASQKGASRKERTSGAVELAMIKPIFKRAKPEDVEEVLSFIQAYYAFDDIRFRPAEVAAALRVLLSDLSFRPGVDHRC